MSIVCLGEALVDLIGEPPGAQPRRFEVHFGGALANVAVAIARAGAPAALAGGSGCDEFGNFLRDRLEREGVELDRLRRLPELVTPFAFVYTDASGEPQFEIHGDGIDAGIAALAGSEAELIAGAEGLVLGSNTLVSAPGRAVTLAAAAEAKRAGVPVLFDPNLRPGRWAELGSALELCRELADGCLLIKANLTEARLLLAEPELDAAEAAAGLAGLGARLAVVTVGAAGAFARGAAEAEAGAEPVERPSPLGAGDAFMGALVAGLHTGGWQPAAVGGALPAAVAAGADACRRSGAIE